MNEKIRKVLEKKFMFFSVLAIAVFWLTDALIDYSAHYDETFMYVLFYDRKELSFRLLVSIFFLSFGVIVSVILNRKNRAENALRESEERYRSLVNNINLGVTMISRDYSIVITNNTQGHYFKKNPKDLVGRKCYREFEKREAICPNCPGNRAMETGQPASAEATGRRDDGSSFTASILAFPVINTAGRIDGFIEVVEDITDKKRLQDSIERSNRLESIGLLAGGIAHDFNNILTSILSSVHLSGMMVERGSEVFKSLQETQKMIFKAASLTQQLMTFSRGGAPVRKTAYINEIIKESAAFALRGSNVRCEYRIADDLWPAEIDEAQMNQVIHNLVLNANQSMPDGGTITIDASNAILKSGMGLPLPEGKYIKIVIRDEGEGISEENMPKIFDPYFTTKDTGRGLGLSIIYSIVRRHDGHISVESESGRGTVFTMYLPASDKKVSKTEDSNNTIVFGQGNILFMDDDEMIRKTVGRMLSELGYNVEFARDGGEAVGLFSAARNNSGAFDLVILDLTVPGGMGGEETIKKLQELDPEVRAIVSSGYSNDPVMANYREYGFINAIAKPIENLEELSILLHKLISSPQTTEKFM